jgi:hypothetical protein
MIYFECFISQGLSRLDIPRSYSLRGNRNHEASLPIQGFFSQACRGKRDRLKVSNHCRERNASVVCDEKYAELVQKDSRTSGNSFDSYFSLCCIP